MRIISKRIEEICEVEYGTRVVQKKDGGTLYPVYGGGGETFKVDTYNREDSLIISRFAMSKNCVRSVKGKFFLNDSGLSVKTKDKKELSQEYLDSLLKSLSKEIYNLSRGTAQRNLNMAKFRSMEIKYPDSISEQIHIADVLCRAEELIQKRKVSLALLDEFLKSQFLEMFGDPVRNERGWEMRTMRSVSERISDGPFGSNLKTSHYSDSGIRVIRLKNIGINRFLSEDEAYVSQIHFDMVLKKYSCFPGDVVIGTMGEPNIRACILPKSIKIAVNKADCVLFRPNTKIVLSEFISHLLNLPAFISLAANFFHGQTRTRISMGQLAEIAIPIPPLPLQNQFAQIVEKTEVLKDKYRKSLVELENLYGSLSQRAFRGELG